MEVVAALIDLGANDCSLLILADSNGTSCLYLSALVGNVEAVKVIAKAGGRNLGCTMELGGLHL